MIVRESTTPFGREIKKSSKREYTVSGIGYKYCAPRCEIITFENAVATSGSWEHGLAGIIKDGKFYHERFTKDAENFRTKSPFWSNARGEFKIDLEYVEQMNTKIEECFTWFNIGQYWHWFLEDLPLVEAFRQQDGVIFTNVLTQWQLDSLDFFPDIKNRIVQLDTPISINCKKIHVATYPAISYRGKAAKWAVEFLRDNLTPSKDHDGPKRIYISRNDALARNVKNEAEVLDLLVDKYGFAAVNTHKENSMARMSLQQKIDMFASADVVVSPTGAGLTHTHAMKPGSTVIDFNHSFEVPEECGWNNIGDVCGLNWNTFAAETLDMPIERPKQKNSHMRVDIDTLEYTLANALSKAP